MITFNSGNGYFTATLQADAAPNNEAMAFSLSRTMLRLRRYDVIAVTQFEVFASLSGGMLGPVTYYSDPNGVLEIPLRNWVNEAMAQGEADFVLFVYMFPTIGAAISSDNLSVVVNIQHGISYYDTLAPRQKDFDLWPTALLQHYYVLPPNVMLNPDNGQGLIVESNFGNFAASQSLGLGYYSIVNGISSSVAFSGERSNQLAIPATSQVLRLSDGSLSKNWHFEKPSYCSDVVVCRWTSLTGAVRQHYFPIVAFINGVGEEVSIVEAGNGYDIRKNAFKGVRCRLTGLTAYSVWYYQDILQASDLHAVVHPTFSIWSTEIASMETAAYAEGKDTETPQGNGFYNFEFTLKLRHYDTF